MESSEILNINIAPRKDRGASGGLVVPSNHALLSPISASGSDHFRSLDVAKHAYTETKDENIIDIDLPESGAQGERPRQLPLADLNNNLAGLNRFYHAVT